MLQVCSVGSPVHQPPPLDIFSLCHWPLIAQARLEDFLALGITRVSMGVQSFDAGLLEACGRAHSLADVYQAVELLRKAKADNFSIDLMRYFGFLLGGRNRTSGEFDQQ